MIPIRQERDARKLLKAGVTVRDVAKASGISERTAGRIRARMLAGIRPRLRRCDNDDSVLDATDKTLFSPPPWFLCTPHENIVSTTGPEMEVITCGRSLIHGEVPLWYSVLVRRQANARLIVNAPELWALTHDLDSLAKLKLIDHALFKQLADRAKAILKKVGGVL